MVRLVAAMAALLCVFAALLIILYRMRLHASEVRFGRLLSDRSKMAHEIHDTLLQGFAGVTLMMEGVTRRYRVLPDEAHEALEQVLAQADQCLSKARNALWDMRSPLLDGVGLPIALRAVICRYSEGTPTQISLRVQGHRKLTPEMEGNLFRIAEEALSNAIRHGAPRTVKVELQLSRRIRLSIIDDGRGFLPEKDFSTYGGRWGMLGMRERAEQIGGRFSISSKPGQGALVEVEIAG